MIQNDWRCIAKFHKWKTMINGKDVPQHCRAGDFRCQALEPVASPAAAGSDPSHLSLSGLVD